MWATVELMLRLLACDIEGRDSPLGEGQHIQGTEQMSDAMPGRRLSLSDFFAQSQRSEAVMSAER